MGDIPTSQRDLVQWSEHPEAASSIFPLKKIIGKQDTTDNEPPSCTFSLPPREGCHEKPVARALCGVRKRSADHWRVAPLLHRTGPPETHTL